LTALAGLVDGRPDFDAAKISQILAGYPGGEIFDAILSTVCPNLVSVLTVLGQGRIFVEQNRKIATTFLVVCQSRPGDEREAASAAFYGNRNQLWTEDEFFDSSVSFEQLLSEDVQRPALNDRVCNVVAELLDERVESFLIGNYRVPNFDLEQTKDALAFGRALGLSVRYSIDISRLRLSPIFLRLLSPDIRAGTVGIEALSFLVQRANPERIDLDALSAVFRGFEEAIGPLHIK
jgi:hypothetical protein